jgi:hypothetical protein
VFIDGDRSRPSYIDLINIFMEKDRKKYKRAGNLKYNVTIEAEGGTKVVLFKDAQEEK